MAYITRKKINGITYYYAEHREWKDGKSQRKWQKYLGTADKIMKAMDNSANSPEYAVLFEYGGISSYLDIAMEMNLVEIIDSMLPKRSQGVTIGEYILIAAINRGLNVVSKRSMWGWFENTILLNYFSYIKKNMLSSQRFWDNMNLINKEIIPQVWIEIIHKAIAVNNIDLSLVSYDGTNFYTFISTFNTHNSIAQRGKNKQGRKNLRQVNYALFCTQEDHIPLYFDVYPGNTHDSTEFNSVIKRFKKAYSDKISQNAPITLVFDKGNNSKENFEQLDQGPFHFIGSQKLNEHQELALISNKDTRLTSFNHSKLEGIKAFRINKQVYGKERTLVLTFNNNLYNDQIRTVYNDIEKCLLRLSELSQRLNDRAKGIITRGKKPTIESVKKNVKEILKRQYMKDIVQINYSLENNIPVISYFVDTDALADIADTWLGKKILITDNHHWKTEDIIIAYHGQYIIEEIFKDTKDRDIGCWWPMYHYTDQKIMVHGLYCTITILVRSLMMRKTRMEGLSISIKRLHKELEGIKQVLNFYPDTNGKKPVCPASPTGGRQGRKIRKNSTITKMNELQEKLYRMFNMKKYLSV